MMRHTRLHAKEVESDAELVSDLIAVQFSQWADLEVTPLLPSGTDNRIFRVGDALAARMPRTARSAKHIRGDQRVLEVVGPRLPVATPTVLAIGEANERFGLPWAIHSWVEGTPADEVTDIDTDALAVSLAEVVHALHQVDAPGATSRRGAALSNQNGAMQSALPEIADAFDVDAITGIWADSLGAPEWNGRPVWLHGDLMGGNILIDNSRVVGLIDFGCAGLGDPAVDCIPAWNLLGEARQTYRATLEVDDAMWRRGRGWALSMAVLQLLYYRESNHPIAENARGTITAVLNEAADRLRG